MAKVCLLFLLLAGVCLPGIAQTKTIAIIGSSTAAGYGLLDQYGQPMLDTWDNSQDDAPVNSWPNRLRRYYDGLGLLNALNNFAIYGEDIYQAMPDDYHTPDGRNPVDGHNNITAALSVSPDIILINFPSNSYDVLGVDEVMDRFHDLYQQATANGHTVCYICTSQPRTSDGWDPAENPDHYLEARQNLKIIRDRIVAEFPSNYIDFYTPVLDATSPITSANYLGIKPEYSQGDGTHLNDAGHEVFYNAILAKNIVPIAPLPLKVGKVSVKRIDDQHITVTFTVLDGNTEKEFFIWVKDKAGNTKSVRVVIPDKTKNTQTISETIQIY